ncbi:MAG: right-handed parallel beta-helix repeat-containing protein [Phycisphaeraceae bacterium JB051]
MKRIFVMCLLAVSLLAPSLLKAQDTLQLIPTLEACSIYLKADNRQPDQLTVQYRAAADTQWLDGHALSRSDNDPTLRTSLFYLNEETGYQVRVLNANKQVIAEDKFQTWSANPPVAKTVFLNAGDFANGGLHLTQGGTESGWVRYVGDGHTVMDVANDANAAIHVEKASFIILDNIILKGGIRHGIHLNHASNIIIRNCDISGYGRLGTQRIDRDGKYYDQNNKAINWDSGINIDLSQRILIEHNFIHDPRSTANSWYYSHPAGPNAIFLRAKGQIVIRYNDMIGSDEHRWNDVIEAYGNGHFDGGFNRDSDIYGNYLAFANDDGIELDGGQCNVRFWGNKVEGTLCGISTAANVHGPSYIFNNLVVNLGDERAKAGSAVKNGGGTTYTHGISHFFHNTFFTQGNGIMAVGYGRDDNRSMFYGISRNNLLALSGKGIRDAHTPEQSDFDFDLFATPDDRPGEYESARPIEAHGIVAPAKLRDPKHGDYRPQTSSPANHAGDRITGLTHATQKQPPTIGAFAMDQNPNYPLRDLPIVVSPQQLQMTVDDSATQAPTTQVSISTQQLDKPIAYRILKNSVFDWMTVTPEKGVFLPGKEHVLRVTVDRSKLDAFGMIPSSFLIKLNDGRSLPVTIYVKHVAFEWSKIWQASELDTAKAFTRDAGEVRPKEDDGTGMWFAATTNGKLGDRCLAWQVDLPQDGLYYLAIEVKTPSPSGLHDSAYLSVDGEEAKKVGVMPGGYWHWSPIAGKLQSWELKKGVHTFKLYPREPIYIKQIRMQTNAPSLLDD